LRLTSTNTFDTGQGAAKITLITEVVE